MGEIAGSDSDLDRAAEIIGTVKQFLKVIEERTAELVNEQKADLVLNREQLTKLRTLMGQIATSAQGAHKDLSRFVEKDARSILVAHVEAAAGAAGRAQAKELGKEIAAEARQALQESAARANAAAQSLEEANRQLRRHNTWRSALVTTACSFGVAAAAFTAVLIYLPSKTEIDSLRSEHAQLEASIKDLNNRGARLKYSMCGDQKRLCVLIPANSTPWKAENRDTVYVVPVGY
jgi:hypothetical protein